MATNVLISTVDFERSSTCLMPSIDGDPYIDYRTTATRCKEPCVDGVVRELRPYTVVRRDPWYTHEQRGLYFRLFTRGLVLPSMMYTQSTQSTQRNKVPGGCCDVKKPFFYETPRSRRLHCLLSTTTAAVAWPGAPRAAIARVRPIRSLCLSAARCQRVSCVQCRPVGQGPCSAALLVIEW